MSQALDEILEISVASGVEAEEEVTRHIRSKVGRQNNISSTIDTLAEDDAARVDVIGCAHRLQRLAVNAILAIIFHLHFKCKSLHDNSFT